MDTLAAIADFIAKEPYAFAGPMVVCLFGAIIAQNILGPRKAKVPARRKR